MAKKIEFSVEDIKKLERAVSKRPQFKTSTGYTGNSKSVKERKKNKNQKKEYSKKQRGIEHLTRDQRRNLWRLQNQLDQMFQKNSHITRKEDGKLTKKDMKKGLGADGIHSINTYKDYFKKIRSFFIYCVEHYDVKSIGGLKTKMIYEYIEYNIDKGLSPKTIGDYITPLKKMTEFGIKDNIKSMKKFMPDNKRLREVIPQYKRKDYKRGKKYDIKHVQIIAKQADLHFSKLHRLAVEILGYSGPRIDEFVKIKWRHFDFENNRVYLTDDNMTKGARPRFVPVPEKTMELAKQLYNLGLIKDDNQRIWGSKMSHQDVREFIKECARLGKTRYSGVHDFRRSAIKYQISRMEKLMHKGLLTKEMLVNMIMDHVNVDPRLNSPKTAYKKDSKGKFVRMKTKNGRWVKVPQRDKNGNVVKYIPFVQEDLLKRRKDYLIDAYLAQVLGHTRSDIQAVYTDEEAVEKKKSLTKESTN
ncbi:tyrosine-type recombinase/integrase [Bacillus sp. 1P02SD]|uniref:tyrosine-type recombinase/integrase n=1 Tax=Bacillus sp. 1P02SD TaxID=3132264 RepID=UPI0039A033A9